MAKDKPEDIVIADAEIVEPEIKAGFYKKVLVEDKDAKKTFDAKCKEIKQSNGNEADWAVTQKANAHMEQLGYKHTAKQIFVKG